MSEDIRRAILETYERSRQELMTAISSLTEAQSVERTFDGWSLKDHLVHLATWDEVRASEVERISAGYDSAWRMTDEQDAVYNRLATALRWDLSLDQVMWELETSRRKLLDAIARATPRGLDASLYGDAPLIGLVEADSDSGVSVDAGLISGHESQHTGWIRAWRLRMGYS